MIQNEGIKSDDKEERIKKKEEYKKDAKPVDKALTFPEEWCSQQRIDYIFCLIPKVAGD